MAQNMSICNFCELSNNIKWKCINCDLILCEECKTIKHPKFKGSECHIVIEFNLLGTKEATNAKRKLDLQNIFCSSYCEEKCCLYCQNCKIPICLSCILEKHRDHKSTKIEVVYDNQYTELEKCREAVELDLSQSAEIKRSIHDRKQRDLNSYNTIKEKITEREKEMKDSVTAQVVCLIKELDELYLSDTQFIAKEEEQVKKYEKDLDLKKADIDKALNTCQAISVLNTIDKIDFKMPGKNFNEFPKEETTIFTQLEPEMNINLKVLKVKHMVEVSEIYDTGETIISNLKTLQNGICVMMNDESQTIKHFFFKDGKCIFVKSIEVDVFDLAVTKDGNILVSVINSGEIFIIRDSGKELFKSIAAPKETRGIHILRNQTLCVGFVDRKIQQGGIAIIDMKSDQYQEFAIIPAESIPEKITSDIKGNICVIQTDSVSTWKGKIVSYEISPSLGQVNWRYEGNEHINELRDFSPCDIAISHASLVLIVDSSSNIIHVLSSNGSFLTFIGEREGIYSPRSLNVDNEGRLQIGSDETKDEFAKIYIAKLIT